MSSLQSLHRLGIIVMASLALGAMPTAARSAAAHSDSAPSASRSASADEALFARIDAMAQAAVSEKKTAGVAIGVSRNGKLIYARGFGAANLELQAPVTADTVFRIGSVTKQFTAAAIVQLAERGLVGYDDPMSKYFPEFPRSNKVTIRQLLLHTSGLSDFTRSRKFHERETRFDHSTAEMVAYIKGQKRLYDFTPGTRWRYSNSGYYMLGALVEKVSGQTLRAYLQEHIFQPLGLTHTSVDDESEIVPNRASGYRPDDAAPDGFSNAKYASITVPGGAGALRSTVTDLLRWHEALFSGKVTSEQGLKLMTTPGRVTSGENSVQAVFSENSAPGRRPPPFTGYGFGLRFGEYQGHEWVGHGGAISGFSSDIKTYPQERLTLVVLTNTGGAVMSLEQELSALVFGAQPAATQ